MDKSWKPDPKTGLPTLDQHREACSKTMTQPGFCCQAPKPIEISDESIVDELDE